MVFQLTEKGLEAIAFDKQCDYLACKVLSRGGEKSKDGHMSASHNNQIGNLSKSQIDTTNVRHQ